VYKPGCDVFLSKKDGKFVGGTQGKGCESVLRGASYATTIVSVSKGLLVSWDRGYDKKDEQAWGATEGGYEFVKE
jgi:CpeT protein